MCSAVLTSCGLVDVVGVVGDSLGVNVLDYCS